MTRTWALGGGPAPLQRLRVQLEEPASCFRCERPTRMLLRDCGAWAPGPGLVLGWPDQRRAARPLATSVPAARRTTAGWTILVARVGRRRGDDSPDYHAAAPTYDRRAVAPPRTGGAQPGRRGDPRPGRQVGSPGLSAPRGRPCARGAWYLGRMPSPRTRIWTGAPPHHDAGNGTSPRAHSTCRAARLGRDPPQSPSTGVGSTDTDSGCGLPRPVPPYDPGWGRAGTRVLHIRPPGPTRVDQDLHGPTTQLRPGLADPS